MTLMREKALEIYLIKRVRARGGLCLKFVSPGHAGVPDRLVILPNRPVHFVEVKAPGKKPRPLQMRMLNELHDRGCQATWVDSKEGINELFP